MNLLKGFGRPTLDRRITNGIDDVEHALFDAELALANAQNARDALEARLRFLKEQKDVRERMASLYP